MEDCMKLALMLVRTAVFVGALATSSSWALPRTNATPGDDVATLSKKVKDADEKVRRQAVEDLATAKTPEAWALVVDALADPSPLVADEAQIRLGDVDAAGLKAVFGKGGTGAKESLVQMRAVEAIGRMQVEIDAVALAKMLSNKDPDVRRATAHAIELLSVSKKLEPKSRKFALQQLDAVFKSDREPDVRAAIIPARYGLEEYTVSDLMGMMLKRDIDVVRASATHSLASAQFSQIFGPFNEDLEAEDYSAVRALVDELYLHPKGASANSLTKVLYRYRDLRLKWLIVDMLRDWTGLPNGLDEAFWKGWGITVSDDWKPNAPAADAPARGYKTPAVMLGMPMLDEKLGDGTAAKAKVKAELGKMLEKMPEKSQFMCIPYGATPAPWDKALVDVKADTIRRAQKAVEPVPATGSEAFYEAAGLALVDKGVDTILVITDSAPSGAHNVHADVVRERMLQRNRYRQVVIEALLVHPDASAWSRRSCRGEPCGKRSRSEWCAGGRARIRFVMELVLAVREKPRSCAHAAHARS
jgi:hypothetical protein